MSPTVSPYGQWQSPISASLVAESSGSPGWVGVHGDQVIFAKPVTGEGGRTSLFRYADGAVTELLPAPWNARNRVHEYGGRPWASVGDTLVFTNWDDQRIYALDLNLGGDPRPITVEPKRHHGVRYTDLHAGIGDTVWCVRETATGDAPTDIEHDIVSVPIDGGAPTSLVSSHHFLSVARPSPDGRHIAWIGWDHPAMPWDGTELCVAEIGKDGGVGEHRVIAGGPAEAVCQFAWDGPDRLVALTDPQGWWNLHRIALDGTSTNLLPEEVECGGPLWQSGSQWFAQLGDDRFVMLRGGHAAVLDAGTGVVTDIPGLADVPNFSATLAVHGDTLYAAAAGPARKSALIAVDTVRGGYTALTPQPENLPDPAYLPAPVVREFADAQGNRVPAFVYLPQNPDYVAPQGELPPFMVHVHGGPTGGVSPVLDLDFAYFTSRGIGVVAVNYGGSSGYGRAFRERLNEQWGVVDIADCATVADALVAEGTADGARLAIRGGSAGGYTAALAIGSTRTYAAATVMYPITDLRTFAELDTHDFESQYTVSMVGPLEETERYTRRSPMSHVDTVAGPVLMLQGMEDKVCPPEQAKAFIGALDGSGTPHAYLRFAGEQHGFRKAETIIAATEAEFSFYGSVFGFSPVGVAPIELVR